MTITLSPEMEKIVKEKLEAGYYATAEDVVMAALQFLDQEMFGDFEPGELDKLLAEAEKSLNTEGALDGEEAFAAMRARRKLRGKS